MHPLKGILAGCIATVVLSIVMIAKTFAHMLPAFDTIRMIHSLTGGPLISGWLGHFVIGALIWGTLFAIIYRGLPSGVGLIKGLAFGVLAWLAMMLVFLPLVGAGFFGLAIGWPVAVAALVLHLIYGSVLGISYVGLTRSR